MKISKKVRMAVALGLWGLAIVAEPAEAPATGTGEGSLFVEVTNVLQQNLPGKIEVYPAKGGEMVTHRLNEGKLMAAIPAGEYVVYVYVYDWDIPIMVDLQAVSVAPGGVATVSTELVVGAGGSRPIRSFDQDSDLVLDQVELAAKTDPTDPDSFPNAELIPFDSPVLSAKAGWYKGDLHVRSIHGGGKESVKELVARAEKRGLDFIAITDRNTMNSCFDPDFQSSKVVLIPAMEWGTDDRGVALIYGPHTYPKLTSDIRDDQGVCQRVQAQGGIFAIAHPCFPNAPWQRGLAYVNAVEVWCREFRGVPPVSLSAFVPEYGRRVDGKLSYSISRAASVPSLSANGQATMFWDYELVRGLKACPIAGSLSSSPDVPLGSPVTWVYAPEKSARGILYGLRQGRTVVSVDSDGPFLVLTADVKQEKDRIVITEADMERDTLMAEKKTQGTIGPADVGIGGVIPLQMPVNLVANVKNAKGMKLEILRNGWPIMTMKVNSNKPELFGIAENPASYAVYRARLVRTPDRDGYGALDVAAMTGPIYAQNIVPIIADDENPFDIWLKIENKSMEPVPVSATMEEGGKQWVRTQGGPVQPIRQDEFQLPPDAQVQTLDAKPLR
jgi:hypothetical protein